MSVGGGGEEVGGDGGGTSLQNRYIDELSSTLHKLLYFSLTGPL